MPELTPETISMLIALGAGLAGGIGQLIHRLRGMGVSEEQLGAIDADYDARIARREGEVGPSSEG